MTATTTITRSDHRTEVVPLAAGDGAPISLLHVRVRGLEPDRGPVMVVHGAGVRAELFRPPTPRTIVDALLEEGWDVWLLNWRASIDFDPLPWTLCDAAVFDYPIAVRHILDATGAATMKAIVHCQGSTSFMMAAVAGLVPAVDTVISNAVSLHPVVPAFSAFKLSRVLPLAMPFTPYLSPGWGKRPRGRFARALRRLVLATHWECNNPVCRMVSFQYGTGHPALWSHRHLDAATHDWISGEFAEAPMTFFDQMRQCVALGHLKKVRDHPELPDDFVAQAPKTDARFVFLAGADNLCFLAESQRRTYEFFDHHRPGRDNLHIIPGYGHLDVFLGRDAWRDTYPLILEELKS